ncbi:MAG: peptidylprolyl isomerase, partial [Dethiobacteria bacterium]
FEDAAFALAVGERSEPVKTIHGYHVIETLEHKEGRKVTYEEVAEEVKEALKDEKIPLLIQELIMRLKEEAVIDYRD